MSSSIERRFEPPPGTAEDGRRVLTAVDSHLGFAFIFLNFLEFRSGKR